MTTRTHSRNVTVRCIECNGEREILPGEIAPDDMPVCKSCGSIMLPVKAEAFYAERRSAFKPKS